MAKVSTHIGLTVHLGRPDVNEYVKVDAEISEIDTDQPLEPQIELAAETVKAVFVATQQVIEEKLEALMGKKLISV